MWRNVGVSATQSVEVGCADTESPYYMTFARIARYAAFAAMSPLNGLTYPKSYASDL